MIAALACVSTFIPSENIGERLALTFTVLLTLTTLTYSTALNEYHEACHYLVYGVIAHNVFFFLYAARCKTCAAELTARAAAETDDFTRAAPKVACDASADVSCVAATVASTWGCSMCEIQTVFNYGPLFLDIDDFLMCFVIMGWIYWNVKWFANPM